jgi:hypothetical protein
MQPPSDAVDPEVVAGMLGGQIPDPTDAANPLFPGGQEWRSGYVQEEEFGESADFGGDLNPDNANAQEMDREAMQMALTEQFAATNDRSQNYQDRIQQQNDQSVNYYNR